MLKQNLACLRNKPDLAGPEPSGFSLERSHCGEWSLVLDGKFLTSRYNPSAEAKKKISVYDPYDHAVFLGLGSAAHILEFLRVRQKKGKGPCRIIILEQNKDLIRLVFEHVDLSLFSSFDVSLITEVRDLIPLALNAEFAVISFPGCMTDTGFYEQAMNLISMLRTNWSTRQRFRKILISNSLKNLKHTQGLRVFRKPFPPQKDLTGVITGAGPSLEKGIFWLIGHRKKIVLMASDTSLPVLSRAGLDPDLVFSGDPQMLNFHHFLVPPGISSASSARLVADLSVHPFSRALFNDHCILTDTGSPFTGLWKEAGEIVKLRMGGSVTAGAFAFLYAAGIRDFIFLGQDYCFRSDRSHCPGTLYDREFLKRTTRLKTLSVWHRKTAFSGRRSIREVMTRSGRRYTDALMDSYRQWMEKEISGLKDVRIKNLSEESEGFFLHTGPLPEPKAGDRDAFLKALDDLPVLSEEDGLSFRKRLSEKSVLENRPLMKPLFSWFYGDLDRYSDQKTFGEKAYQVYLDKRNALASRLK